MRQEKEIQTLLDILFEQRNKAYGAYDIRTKYSKNLLKATIIGSLSILSVFLFSFMMVPKAGDHPDLQQKPIVHVLTDWPQEDPLITPEIPEEVPQEKVIPPKVAQERFVEEYEPVDDKTVKDEAPPRFKDLDDVVISNQKKEGPTLVDVIVPPKLGDGPNKKVVIAPPPPPAKEKVFLSAQKMPQFNGGDKAFYKYLSKNLRYPSQASRNNIEGIVFMSFIIEKDGTITDIQVLKGIGFGCDKEAERVIQKMPKWEPGQQNGKNVRVRFTIPIKFKIS